VLHSELTPEQAASRRPNVIWILCDQLRAQTLGYRGDDNLYTPNIDNLARMGVRFDAAVSGAPWCAPFRGALLTSLYPHQNGVNRTPSPLRPDIPTIARTFNKEGYHTAWVGKWHLDGSNTAQHYVPPERRGGFAYWMGYECNDNQNEAYIFGSDDETVRRLDGYETDALTDIMIGHLRKHCQTPSPDGSYQPFFAALSVVAPHNPFVTPPVLERCDYGNRRELKLRANVPPVDWVQQKARMDLAGYCGMIENLDRNIGRLRRTLQELNVDRETYVVFFSDHGDCLGSHAQWGKSSPWEEAIRIPFIIAKEDGANPVAKGVSDAVINHVDIAPTTLGLCGIATPEGMTGYDYSPLVTGNRQTRAETERQPEPDSAYLQQIPRKYHRHSVNQAWRGVLMRDGWKYVCMPGHDWLLFDTRSDPYELANLCYDTVFQAQRERCHARLQQWIDETGDRFELPEVRIR